MTGQEEIARTESEPEERALWRAVIGRAFLDASWVDPRPGDPLDRSQRELGRLRDSEARIEARVWLRGKTKDFLTVCEFAGIDPIMVREIAARAEAADWPPIKDNPMGPRNRALEFAA